MNFIDLLFKKSLFCSLIFCECLTFARSGPGIPFIENKNQWDHRIRFKASIPQAEVMLLRDRIQYLVKNEFNETEKNSGHKTIAESEGGHRRVILEHHCDVAVFRFDIVDDLVADPHLAVGDLLEPSDHSKRSRLAATRWPDEDQELAIFDIKTQVMNCLVPVFVDLVDLVEHHCCHVGRYPRGRSCGSISSR